jgi:hypothetical protein
MCFRVFLCCVVLCRWRPCVGLIPRPRSPTECPNRFVSSEVLNRNRPWTAYTLDDDDLYKVVGTTYKQRVCRFGGGLGAFASSRWSRRHLQGMRFSPAMKMGYDTV